MCNNLEFWKLSAWNEIAFTAQEVERLMGLEVHQDDVGKANFLE
jgi:hypothetical protein